MNPKVDVYLTEGCGRCPLGGTPACKIHDWREAIVQLRRIALDCGLTEELKWGMPCYTSGGRNIVLAAAFKDYCALAFFKGALLDDPDGVLVKPGENSQATRQIRFADVREVLALEPVVRAYLRRAVDVENAGLKVPFKKNPEPIPDELQHKLAESPVLKAAFDALTPGRQRGYILHISAPKQAETRASRVEKCTPQILAGKGIQDR